MSQINQFAKTPNARQARPRRACNCTERDRQGDCGRPYHDHGCRPEGARRLIELGPGTRRRARRWLAKCGVAQTVPPAAPVLARQANHARAGALRAHLPNCLPNGSAARLGTRRLCPALDSCVRLSTRLTLAPPARLLDRPSRGPGPRLDPCHICPSSSSPAARPARSRQRHRSSRKPHATLTRLIHQTHPQ
jgi:hypothetical protein